MSARLSTPTRDSLTREYNDWLLVNGLPEVCAEELLHFHHHSGHSNPAEELTPNQLTWLNDFIARWEAMEAAEAAEDEQPARDIHDPALAQLATLRRKQITVFIARGMAIGLGGAYLGPLFSLGSWEVGHLTAFATLLVTLVLTHDLRQSSTESFLKGYTAAWSTMAKVVKTHQ